MKVSKHCEWCGEYSENAYYVFVGKLENIYFLKSPLISRIDYDERTITLKTGQIMDFVGLQSPDEAVSIRDFMPHIFCSEKCEYDYLNAHASYHSSKLFLQTPVWKIGYFSPHIIEVERLRHETVQCESCGKNFPNLCKSFCCTHINEFKIIPGIFKQDILEATLQYPVVLSDLSETHPNGAWYQLNVDYDRIRKAQFCSNECCYDYATAKNDLVAYQNNIFDGLWTSICPFTVRINQGLGNKYIYRPQKMN